MHAASFCFFLFLNIFSSYTAKKRFARDWLLESTKGHCFCQSVQMMYLLCLTALLGSFVFFSVPSVEWRLIVVFAWALDTSVDLVSSFL